MAFDVNTITLKGAELLAAATSSDKLIISGCDADAQVRTLEQAVALTTRVVSPLSTSTEVTQISASSNAIYVRAYFRAGVTTGGSANSVYLYGHLESDPTHDFIIYVSSSSTSFHLPEVGDIVEEWEIRFEILYNPLTNSVGFATQSSYATTAELDYLESRVVTTHKDGDSSTGDNQTILGEKTFSDWVHSGKVFCTESSGNIDIKAAKYSWLPSDLQGKVCHRIGLLRDDSISDITDISSWEGFIEVSGYSRDPLDAGTSNNSVYLASNNASGTNAYISVGNNDSEPVITIKTDWYSEGIDYSNMISINTDNIILSVKNTDLSNTYAYLTIDYISSSHDLPAILPDSNHNWQLGEEGGHEFERGHFKYIYTTNTLYVTNNESTGLIQTNKLCTSSLYGLNLTHDSSTNTLAVSVGNIVMLWIVKPSINSTAYKAGDVLTITLSSRKVAKNNNQVWEEGNDWVEAGKYQALHDIIIASSDSSAGVPLLARRIPD